MDLLQVYQEKVVYILGNTTIWSVVTLYVVTGSRLFQAIEGNETVVQSIEIWFVWFKPNSRTSQEMDGALHYWVFDCRNLLPRSLELLCCWTLCSSGQLWKFCYNHVLLDQVDQIESNFIKPDQTWSNLIKLDQTWSFWNKSLHFGITCCWKTCCLITCCWKTCFLITCCWKTCCSWK